ncbi:hypothetical protein KFK09_027020 [Dendrobium nobile]|uniref:HMG box domain-containing protein n=1 Tax=Dendrobium nobile TaxID=94219 RepID=A0A8T3A9N5_DENNO|nr:hypothetical protein KFK09_027020 [Dendrobium nobile]
MAVEDSGAEVVALNKAKELPEPKPNAREAEDKETELNSNYQAYPEALASYQDVVESKSLFMESLEKLHREMTTKFIKWREVTNAFNFPSSATNASFILRKYYISLLRHYEQIYFFRAKGWTIPSAVSLSTTRVSVLRTEKTSESAFALPEIQSATRKRKKGNEDVALTAPLGQALSANRKVVGVIDGKFENGYFVTVTVGTNKLKGVLFHALQQNAVQVQPVYPSINNSSTRVIRRRRRRKVSTRDPTHPKPNRSGYNFFFAEQHAKLKLLHPGKDREISRRIGELWNNLTETERAVYQDIGLKDKERYQSEMVVYKEKQRTGPVLTDVMPIQQLPAEPSIEMQNMNLKGTEEVDKLFEDSDESLGEKSNEEQRHSPEPGAAAAAAEPDMAADPSSFELRRRDLTETENDTEKLSKNGIPSSGDDRESERSAETSSDKNWTESAHN